MALQGALHNRKTRRLAKILSIPVPCALGIMEALWHVTAKMAPTGNIGRLSNQDIADEMFWDDDADTLINALLEAGNLEVSEEHRLIVHGWWDHTDDGTHMKIARARGVFACGTPPRLTRFGGAERASLEQFYAHAVRTASALPEPEPVPVPEPLTTTTTTSAGAQESLVGEGNPEWKGPAEYQVEAFFAKLNTKTYPNVEPEVTWRRFYDHRTIQGWPLEWQILALNWARSERPKARDAPGRAVVAARGRPRTFEDCMVLDPETGRPVGMDED